MNLTSLFYFSTPKFVTLQNVQIGSLNKFFQTCIFAFILYDLCFNELYLKTEIPSGYTTFGPRMEILVKFKKKILVLLLIVIIIVMIMLMMRIHGFIEKLTV